MQIPVVQAKYLQSLEGIRHDNNDPDRVLAGDTDRFALIFP